MSCDRCLAESLKVHLNYTCNFQKPTVNENIKKKVLCSTKVTTKPKPINHRKPDVEDIEYMHIPNEEGIYNRVSAGLPLLSN